MKILYIYPIYVNIFGIQDQRVNLVWWHVRVSLVECVERIN